MDMWVTPRTYSTPYAESHRLTADRQAAIVYRPSCRVKLMRTCARVPSAAALITNGTPSVLFRRATPTRRRRRPTVNAPVRSSPCRDRGPVGEGHKQRSDLHCTHPSTAYAVPASATRGRLQLLATEAAPHTQRRPRLRHDSFFWCGLRGSTPRMILRLGARGPARSSTTLGAARGRKQRRMDGWIGAKPFRTRYRTSWLAMMAWAL
jgi:hypothetical protein